MDDLPPDIESVKIAIQFLNRLPKDVPLPDFGFDPDGELSADWYFGSRQIFSLSFNKDGWLNYAGLIGYSTDHAKVHMSGDAGLAKVVESLRHVLDNVNYV